MSLTVAEIAEARQLHARLGELLGKLDAPAPAPPPPPPAPEEKATLSEADFLAAAQRIGCDMPAIHAVWDTESNGVPFGYDGRATVLYEGHKFSEFTVHRYDKTYGGVSWPAWDRARYPKGDDAERHKANWDRILFAARLDRDAAYRSASYGAPQIMGFNFAACGFADLDSFVAAMNRSAREQLDAFVSLILDWKLDDELREHRWADFARRYNGPRYAENMYDAKLAAAHAKWSASA